MGNEDGKEKQGVAGWWKRLPMSRRFLLRTTLFSLPAAVAAGLLFVLVLVPDKTVGSWLAGAGLGFVAGGGGNIVAGVAAGAGYGRALGGPEGWSRRAV